MERQENGFVIFSGGSGWNRFVDILPDEVTYVIPTSDNGGSTAEIIRVFNGPAIGDLRSRIVRLAKSKTEEDRAVKKILSYRLPNHLLDAKTEWLQILKMTHALYEHISVPFKVTISVYLVLFQVELCKRISPGKECNADNNYLLDGDDLDFDFRNGSVGNFLLTGSLCFFGNLDAAVWVLLKILGCPPNTHVIPVIDSGNFKSSISALLRNGESVIGQCEISHPGQKYSPSRQRRHTFRAKPNKEDKLINQRLTFAAQGSTNVYLSSPNVFLPAITQDPSAGKPLKRSSSTSMVVNSKKNNQEEIVKSNTHFRTNKQQIEPLSAPIRRVYYNDGEGNEVIPRRNSLLQTLLSPTKTIIYAPGSLYTSLIPSLIVEGMGELISKSTKNKILVLNASLDRETPGYNALDFIYAITDALNYSFWTSRILDQKRRDVETKRFFNLPYGTIPWELTSTNEYVVSSPYLPPSSYITHLLYLDNKSILVDDDGVRKLGIVCIKVEEEANDDDGILGVKGYDPVDLKRVLMNL